MIVEFLIMDIGSKSSSSSERILFGLYEVNLDAGELSKSGRRIHLQSQPFHVLAMLLERPGSIVTKDELRHRIWGEDTTVDFDQSLRAAVTKVREVLGDSSDNPRFVETVPRRGYRFIAPISSAEPLIHLAEPLSISSSPLQLGWSASSHATNLDVATVEHTGSAQGLASETRSGPGSKRMAWILALCGNLLFLMGSLLGYGWFGRAKGNSIPVLRQLTFDRRVIVPIPIKAAEQFPSTVTDGVHLFTSAIMDRQTTLVQASVTGGELQDVVLPEEVVSPTLGDISPDNSQLLLFSHSSGQVEMPLWVVLLGGISAHRVAGILGHDATWMPNGSDILYAANDELRIVHPQSGATELFAKTPGRAFWLRWSPDGKRLRFTMIDPITHSQSIWELTSNEPTPRLLLKQWSGRSNECCGVWMRDGSSFIFQSMRNGESDLWRLSGNSSAANPERLTNGPLYFEGPVVSHSSRDRIFFTGVVGQAHVHVFDTATKEFRLSNVFLRDAQEVDFSRDSQWVAWVDGAGRMWRSRSDGKDQLQLIPEFLNAYMTRWSPDSSRIAVMARQLNQPWQLYLIHPDGSGLERLLQEPKNDADPTWSPDGMSLAFGRPPDYLGKDDSRWIIRILDLRTRMVQTLVGSDGLFSPRWSPDGKYIAAMSHDQKKLMLFNWQTRQWKVLVEGGFSNPNWSDDSRTIYAQGSEDRQESVFRISIPDGRAERISTPKNYWEGDTTDYSFIGLARGNAPLVRTRVTGDIYSLDFSTMH